jgi:hypothetical protein
VTPALCAAIAADQAADLADLPPHAHLYPLFRASKPNWRSHEGCAMHA